MRLQKKKNPRYLPFTRAEKYNYLLPSISKDWNCIAQVMWSFLLTRLVKLTMVHGYPQKFFQTYLEIIH